MLCDRSINSYLILYVVFIVVYYYDDKLQDVRGKIPIIVALMIWHLAMLELPLSYYYIYTCTLCHPPCRRLITNYLMSTEVGRLKLMIELNRSQPYGLLTFLVVSFDGLFLPLHIMYPQTNIL